MQTAITLFFIFATVLSVWSLHNSITKGIAAHKRIRAQLRRIRNAPPAKVSVKWDVVK